jgi:hypothetical protein
MGVGGCEALALFCGAPTLSLPHEGGGKRLVPCGCGCAGLKPGLRGFLRHTPKNPSQVTTSSAG